MGANAQHEKHGCLIPLEAMRRGGRKTAAIQKGHPHHYHGIAQSLFDEWAKEKGYELFKNGFPDRIIWKEDEGYIFVEVKRPGAKLRKNQKETMKILQELGLKIIVWRPEKEAFMLLKGQRRQA